MKMPDTIPVDCPHCHATVDVPVTIKTEESATPGYVVATVQPDEQFVADHVAADLAPPITAITTSSIAPALLSPHVT